MSQRAQYFSFLTRSSVRFAIITAGTALLLSIAGCTRTGGTPEQTAVVGIPGDIGGFNPLFTAEATGAEINDLIYPSLVSSKFDTAAGVLRYAPSLAERWEFGNSDRDITFHLKAGAKWADSVAITAADIQYSFQLYGDPELESMFLPSLAELAGQGTAADIARAVEVKNDSTVVFHFRRHYPNQLFDAGLPILPRHIFAAIPRQALPAHAVNNAPVGAGPFRLHHHTAMQEIVLVPNNASLLPAPAKLDKLVFRITPEYKTRLMQLTKGEIDIMTGLEAADAASVAREHPEIRVLGLPARRYHILAWNNIDPQAFASTNGRTIRPHRLFGDPSVRKALTMAIDRQSIGGALLGEYAQEAFGPVAPLFKQVYNTALEPLPYDPRGAVNLLESAGWIDTDKDGIREKNGVKFSFAMKIPAGSVLWTSIAEAVQKQLHDVGIAMTLDRVERSVFMPAVFRKNFDACIFGFEVPLELKLDDYWGSDLMRNQANIVSYRSRTADALLQRARSASDPAEAAAAIRDLQALLHADQPCTFLFWEKGRAAINTRISGMNPGVLGMFHDAGQWTIKGR